jgi:hypothetical protein
MQGPLPVVVDGEGDWRHRLERVGDLKEDEQVAKAGLAGLLGKGAKSDALPRKPRQKSRRFTDLYLISLGSGRCGA